MNWMVALPALFLGILAALFFLGGRKKGGGLFRQVAPQLLLLFLITAVIALSGSPWLKKLFYSPRVSFILWLLFWFLLLILAIKVLAFFIFDFLVLRRQGVRYPKLVKDVMVFILFVVGVLLILRYYLKTDITVLTASSAVLTVVVGFALQDILGNLFSGIILNFEDAFKIGDWMSIADHEGQVEQFGWRSFKIRTIDRELIVFPNQAASKAEVVIYGAGRQPTALKITFGAGYHDSPDRVSAAVLKALESAPDVRREPPPEVQLTAFGDFSLNYKVKFWIDDYSRHRIVASDVRRRIWYAFKRQGIEIPFPRRDVFMRGERAEAIPPAALAAELQRNDVLREIGADRLAELLAAAETMVFGAGETVIREGDDGDYFYHVYSGEVHVLKQGQVIARLRAGDFFGEISLVTGEKINATVVAESESVLILVSSARFKQVIDMDEKTAMKLSAVITRRQSEMEEFKEKNLKADAGAVKKDPQNLFARILKYFAGKE